ncbi:MAG: SusC/RagA family TonB-linked outer membrane protein, partial [Candidatus Cryptobacteroides sp.]
MKKSSVLALVWACICLCGSGFHQVYAQSNKNKLSTITGVVVDEDDFPLPDVAVYDASNPQSGTITGKDGRYTIMVSAKCKELTFEFLGYETQTLSLENAALVHLKENIEMLEATVVTGIYTRKADSFTGSVQTINSESLKRAGNKNVIESLKNLDPSLLVLENLEAGSNPNAMSSMQIRGASSLMGETTNLKSNFNSNVNSPLFILDGFETSLEKIQDMDMNRVESITILKDASAKAIYGSKGGNGVIVIETKSLDSGKTLVSYTGSCSLEMPDLSSYNLCNSMEKLEIERREGYYEGIYSNAFDSYERLEIYNERLRRALDGEDTYWLSKPLRIGIGNKHSLSVEIGNKELKSFTSFGYSDTEGVMKGSSRKVLSGSMNLSYRKKAWTFRNIMSVSSMKGVNSPYGSFDLYAYMNPYYNPYDEEGNLVKVFDDIANPLYDASLNTKDDSEYLDFADNFYVEYSPVKALKMVARVGIDAKRTGAEVFLPSSHSSFFSAHYDASDSDMSKKGSYEQTAGSYTSLSADVSAQFNHTFNKVHDVFATAQYNVSEEKYSEVTHFARGFPNSKMDNIIFARQYAEDLTPYGTTGLNRNLGFLLTSGYSYDNRYMVDLTGKTSASSVFGTDNKWALFWSFGLAWNLHNEEFLKGSDLLKQLKLRASMGSSGNQNYTTNKSITLYNYYFKYYHGFSGALPANMSNPNLAWEQKMDYNVGLDMRAKRLTANLDFYIADTENLVFSQSILPSTGFTSVSSNMGTVRNKGVELNLSYTIWQERASYFSLLFNASLNDNRIYKLSSSLKEYNEMQIENAKNSGDKVLEPVIQYVEGYPVNSIWAVPSLGIDPVSGKEIFLNQQDEAVNTWNSAYLRCFGSEDPLFNGNFGFNSEIHGFGMSCIFNFYGGGYMYNSTLAYKVEGAHISNNVDRRIFTDCWYEEGQVAKFTRSSTNSTINPSSRFVQANNVLRLSSVSLYYEFPYSAIHKLGLSRLRFSIYGSDLYRITAILPWHARSLLRTFLPRP